MIPHPPRGPLRSTPRPLRAPTTRFALLTLLVLPVIALIAAGCNVFGLAAQALPEPDVPAKYAGLHDHSVAVLVWVPRGLETDYPSLRLDLTTAIQSRLQQAQKTGRRELKNSTFPHTPASMVRFQEDHPELDRSPIATVAPRLGVQRLIYVELENLQTRSDQAVDLYRGSATISLRVVEVENGQVKVAYEESGLTSEYPPKAPAEGVAGAGDALIYRGTVVQLATGVAYRFYAHPPANQ
jgi:hypothetical protein